MSLAATVRSAVYLVLLDPKGRLLMLRRANTGFMDGKWSLVSGHVEPYERVKAAMVREAKEEVGISIQEADLDVLGVVHRPSFPSRRVYWDTYLRAHKWEGDIKNLEPGKCSGLEYFPLDALPPDAVDYLPDVLHRLLVLKEPFVETGWEAVKGMGAEAPETLE